MAPETKRQWGKRIRMSDEVIEAVTRKWPSLSLRRRARLVSLDGGTRFARL